MKSLSFIGIDSLADVDGSIMEETDRFQFFVSELTPLSNAVGLHARMRAGIPGDAFAVYNPELLVRKVEGEEAMRAAVARITDFMNSAVICLANTQISIAIVETNLALGADVVRVGPSINNRALPFQQILYPSHVQIPDFMPAPPVRTLSKAVKLQSRVHDAASQIEFWKLNLAALKSKQLALLHLINSICKSRDLLRHNALHERTRLASGYTDYNFQY